MPCQVAGDVSGSGALQCTDLGKSLWQQLYSDRNMAYNVLSQNHEVKSMSQLNKLNLNICRLIFCLLENELGLRRVQCSVLIVTDG